MSCGDRHPQLCAEKPATAATRLSIEWSDRVIEWSLRPRRGELFWELDWETPIFYGWAVRVGARFTCARASAIESASAPACAVGGNVI